jgi:hypothetical protein
MAQRVPAVVLAAAVNFVYIHPTTVSSITDDFTLIYAICDTHRLFKIPPQNELE